MDIKKFTTKKPHYINFKVKYTELLEKYQLICIKIKNIMGNYFSTHTTNVEKHLKTKLKLYNGKFRTKFYNNNENQ